ncbi:MAG: restriction endonuclease subunit S [Desulfuromonadaceae bacterium]
MREGWKTYKIEELGRIVTGKTPSTQNSDNFGNKYPFITPRDMTGQKIIGRTERYISEAGKSTVKNCLLPTNSICVSCIGSDMGKVVMTSENSITNQQLNSIICDDSFDPDFVYYSLVNISAELKNAGHHSTAVPILNKTDFSNFEITAPDLPTQQRIAAILSVLDEKIELNRQTNQTLEAIAQALFKEWLVDFNFPGATGEMQDSELGPIPKGWRVGTLGDVCKNIRKTVHPKDVVADTPYVGLEHIPRKSLGLFSWGVSSDVDSQKTHFKKYNVLFGKLRPYFHKVCIAPLEGICSTDILVIEPLKDDNFSFCLNHLFSNEMITFVSSVADGTRMPRVDWRSISNYEIVVPPESLLSRFNRITLPFYDHIIENNQQAAILSVSRDALLPKLMNGEIAA